MRILAIETSCDETGAAIVELEHDHIKILANIVGSQIATHEPFGGVVPELAARRHAELLLPTVKSALGKSRPPQIDAISVTAGPGLMIALLVGVEAAKALAYAWDKPLLAVNHLHGHIFSVLTAETSITSFFATPKIALIVSGGHTMIVLVRAYGQYDIIGTTQDDAAGEAFDKVAKMLGLPYPGGPEIARVARIGQADKYNLPRPMMDSHDYNFSFAGIKTAVKYLVRDLKAQGGGNGIAATADIAASFQAAITDVLMAKTVAAALEHEVSEIIVCGGVAANDCLREKMLAAVKVENLSCLFPASNLSGDNAAMIGIAGCLKARYNMKDELFSVRADPKWHI